jgi:hypothetical protein
MNYTSGNFFLQFFSRLFRVITEGKSEDGQKTRENRTASRVFPAYQIMQAVLLPGETEIKFHFIYFEEETNMKKLTAVLMALVLALAIGCSACADSVDELMAQQASWLKDSLTTCDWVEKNGDRVTLDIEPAFLVDSDFMVRVELSNGALESSEYTYMCTYDTEVHKLIASTVLFSTVVYADENSEPEITDMSENECHAEFSLDEDGFLVLMDNDADTDKGEIYLMGFERVPCDEKGGEVSEEIKAFFEKEQAGLMGVDYKPLRLLIQEENRICVLAEATVVYPGAQPYYALFFMDTTGAEDTYIVLLSDDDSEG